MQFQIEERPTFPKNDKKARPDKGPERNPLEHDGDKRRIQRKAYKRSEFIRIKTVGRVA